MRRQDANDKQLPGQLLEFDVHSCVVQPGNEIAKRAPGMGYP
jgi:hypothetical protein